MDAGQLRNAGVFAEHLRIGQQVDENGIELDPCDVARAEGVRGEQIASAPHADDRYAAYWIDVIDEVGDVVLEKFDIGGMAIEFRHHRSGKPVDVEPTLLNRHLLGHGRGSSPKGRVRAFRFLSARMRENEFHRSKS